MEDGSSDSQQDPEDPFKTSYGGVNYNELLGLHHDEVIKKLNENKKYPGLKVEKTRAGIVELTLPNGEKRKIATGGQSPSQKQQRHSVWNAEWKAVSSESENVLKYVDDYFKSNEDNKKVLSVVGTTMDDDPTLALTWDKLFKKANRNEYTSVSEMNEVFKHAGYRIETGGRIMGDGKVRLYKTDSDGNEAVVLEEELGENGLAPVRKYLSNNMTTEEANSITSAAMIVRDNLVKKADQFVQEKYKGVVDENGEIDYTHEDLTDEKLASDLLNTEVTDGKSHVTRSIEMALESNYGLNDEGKIVSNLRIKEPKEGVVDIDGDGIPDTIDATPGGGKRMSQEGRDIVSKYLNEPITEKRIERVQYGKEGRYHAVEMEVEVDGWRKTKYDNVLSELKNELNPEDYSILEKVIEDKVGIDRGTLDQRKNDLANDAKSAYITSLNAQATDVEEIAFKLAVDETGRITDGKLAANKVKDNTIKEDLQKNLPILENAIEKDVFNEAKKHNIGIEYVGNGPDGEWVFDSSNYVDPSLEKQSAKLAEYQNELKTIDTKIKENNYESEINDYKSKITKLEEEAKKIFEKQSEYTTQGQVDTANKRLEQLRQQAGDYQSEIDTLAANWQSDIDDYNEVLGLHNELYEEYNTSSKSKGEKLEKELSKKLNGYWGNITDLTKEYEKGMADNHKERLAILKDAEDNDMLSDVINREEDYGKILLTDFSNAVDGIIYGLPAMFGHKASQDYLNLMGQGSETGLEKYMSVGEARSVTRGVDDDLARMQWRRTGRMFAQQTPMIVGAIGSTALLGPMAGSIAYGVLTGVQTGGNTKAQLYNLVDMKDDALSQLKILESAYQAGKISPENYRKQKGQLESTVAMGNLTPSQINNASNATAIIEGSVMMAFSLLGGGTLGNSKKFIDDFLKTNPKNWVTQASRTRWQIMGEAAKNFAGRTGSEIGEESIIYLASEAAQAGILHRESDYSMIGDVMLDSLMLGGGMNIAPILYTATTASMVNSEMKVVLSDYIEDRKKIQKSLENLKPGENKRKAQLHKEMETLTKKIGFLQTGLEVDVLLAGKDNIIKLLESTVDLTNLYADAKVNWGDSQKEIDKKIEEYKQKLIDSGDVNGAEDFQRRLDDTQKAIEDVKDSNRLKLEGDPEDIVKNMYGNKGWQIFKNMLGSKPGFDGLDIRDQLSLIHQNIQKNFNSKIRREAKGSPVVKYHVENAVYGKLFQEWINSKLYGGFKIADEKTKEDLEKEQKLKEEVYNGVGIFETLKRAGLIKNRKTTLENQTYDLNATWINSQRVSAGQTFINSQQSLNEVIKANGGIDAIKNLELIVGKSAEDLKVFIDGLPDLYFKEEAESQNKSIQDVKDEILESFKDGSTKGLIIDGKYIAIGEKDAIQKELNNIDKIAAGFDSHFLMGTVFLHEWSHALDGITMKKGKWNSEKGIFEGGELSQFAENLGNSLRGDKNLNQVHEAAIVRLQNLNTPAKWRKGPDGQSIPLEDQSDLTKDEYVKAVQEILQNPKSRDLRRAAEAKGRRGIGLGRLKNFVGGLINGKIPSLGDFNFKSKNTALQYMVSHINSFEKGKLSGLVKRKIAARGVEAKSLKTEISKLEDELNSVGKDNFSKEKADRLAEAKERLSIISGATKGDVKRSQDINKRRTEKRKLDKFVQNPDGSLRFKDDSEFKNHRNGDTFGRAALEIKGVDISPDGTLTPRDFKDPLSLDLLDREIMKGMSARGVPSGAPMAEFVRRVRSRLHDKFLSEYNYDAIKPIVSEIDGIVFYNRNSKGEITSVDVESVDGERKTYKLPKTKNPIIAEGTEIKKGEALTEGASIFGWMYGAGIIEFAKGDVANKYLKDLDIGSQRAVDIDARTEEGAPKIQIDAGVNLDTDLDNALRTEEEAEQIKLLKEEIGFDDEFKNELRKVAVDIATKIGILPDFNDPKFVSELEKYGIDKLTDKIKNKIGTRTGHIDFLKNNRIPFINLMPVRELVAMEREQDTKIFAKFDERLETKEDIQNAIEEGIIPPDSKNKEKVDTYNKIPQQPVINEDGSRNLKGEKQETNFLKFFFPPTKTPEGKKDNTRGERKTSMSTRVAKVVIKQELDLLLDDADFKQTINEKLKDLGRDNVEKSVSKIKELIQTNPKYKHSMDVRDIKKLANIVKADGLQNVINNGKLTKGYNIDGISQTSINIVQYLFERGDINSDTSEGFIKRMLDSDIPIDLKAEFLSQKTLNRDNEFLRVFADDMMVLMDDLQLNMPQQGGLRFDMFGFTSTYMNPGLDTKYDVSYNDDFQGMMNYLGNVESNIPGVDISSINIMNKNAAGIFKEAIKIQESNLTIAEKLEKLEKLRPRIEAANISNINLFKHVIARVKHLVETKEISPVSAIHFLQIQTNIVMGLRGLSKLDLMYLTDGSQALYINKKGKPTSSKFRTENKKQVANKINPKMLPLIQEATEFYQTKNPKLTSEQAEAKAIENLTWKGEHLGPSANTLGDMLGLIFNNNITSEQLSLEMDKLLDGHSQLIAPKYITDLIDEGGKNNPTNFHRIKFLPENHIKNIYDTKGEGYYDFMVNKEIEKVAFNKLKNIKTNIDKVNTSKKAQDNINKLIDTFSKIAENRKKANEIIEADLKKRGYKFSKDTSKGQTAAEMIKILEDDLKKRGYKFISNRGMSTFDFDETLIIDGKNFIIATPPNTKQTKMFNASPKPFSKLGDRSGLVFLATELREAEAYAEMNRGNVKEIYVDDSKIGTEKQLLSKIKELGYSTEGALTYELIDTRFDNSLKQNEINKVFNALKKDGILGIKYTDGSQVTGGETSSTVIFDKSIISEKPIGEKISSADWPTKGTKLAKQGYEMNFDDFVNVRGGVDGPLLQKMRNQIEKYGPENVFVLTARPQDAATAIDGWLKSKNINIAFENITGLADSRGEAKADWMLKKFAEGYNDMYFVDDALQNVEAVKKVLDQLDVKSKVVQAKIKFSKDAPLDFNKILEQTKGIDAGKRFSTAEARKRGISKGRFTFFVPPSAEDFKGLLYSFLGKGKEGDAHMKFFKENLLDPYAKGYRDWNTYKQTMADDYAALKKKLPNVGKILNKNVKGTSFTNDTAIRVYLWDKAGFDIPGISNALKNKLIKQVNNNPELKQFAEELSVISRRPEGYIKPDEYWIAQTIGSDLNNIVNNTARLEFLGEWINNKNIIFNADNLNKIEAIYGNGFRDALENMLYRMEHGTNRVTGKDKITNKFLNWINGSVGATMFWNMRSAILQTISTVNFINWGDNNVFKAAASFANQPQFWKDFAFIFNSPMLKQRRAGLQIDVSASELTKAFADGRSKPEAVIAYLLEKGFTPTKIADSFAIALGGASFYRNRLNTYIKQGMNEAEAKKQAWLDFQEIAEETQQSSRPDLISMQQAGVMGRIILAWQNTPMQMTRLTKKAVSDLVNRRGDDKTNISKIIYYGVAQNIIFGALQSGLMFTLFGNDEDEEKKKKMELRVANGAFDTLLRGTGVYGAAVATLKNVLLKWHEERKKGWNRDDMNIAQSAIDLSPPIGSKMRKIMNAVRTEKYNKGVSKEIGLRIENPNLSIAANWTEALTNIPVARTLNKMNNVEEALTGNHELWQRVALVSGWSRWSIGVKDEELEQAKIDAKETRKIKKEEKKKIEKEEKKKAKEEEKKKVEEEKKKEGIKKIRCSGIKSNGQRCSIMVETKAESAKCMYHKTYTKEEEKKGTDRDNDGIREFRCTATKSNGQRCKNRTENTNKKCYAHQ